MFALEQLRLVRSFLGAPSRGACPTSEEKLAWVLFYRSHTKLIRSVLKRRGVHESDVDDVEQQVWIDLVEQLGGSEYDAAAGKMSGYVGLIASRTAWTHIRRRSKHPDSGLTTELESTLLDPAPGPLSECERKELPDRARAILAAASSSLSDDDHGMLIMRCIEGRSIREIAATFRVSEECAKKRLQRALEAVRALQLRPEEW